MERCIRGITVIEICLNGLQQEYLASLYIAPYLYFFTSIFVSTCSARFHIYFSLYTALHLPPQAFSEEKSS